MSEIAVGSTVYTACCVGYARPPHVGVHAEQVTYYSPKQVRTRSAYGHEVHHRADHFARYFAATKAGAVALELARVLKRLAAMEAQVAERRAEVAALEAWRPVDGEEATP